MACLSLGMVSCSTDPLDATEKHVYGEDEAPYLRIDTEANNAVTAEFREGRITPVTVNLKDYAEVIQTKMGMTVDDMLAGLETGKVVFYNINSTKTCWDKTPCTKGSTGWYYNKSGLLKDSEGYITAQNYAASIELDKTNKTLICTVPEDVAAGLSITENVGFAINNGKDYDDYVRFSFTITVTNPGMIITSISIPAGDYSSTVVDFSSDDNKKIVEDNLGITFSEFSSNIGDPDGIVALYMVDNTTGEWDTTSDYTANALGYWLNASMKVVTWGSDGYTWFIETSEDSNGIAVGRAPDIASGTKGEINFVYALKADNSKYFQVKVNATME